LFRGFVDLGAKASASFKRRASASCSRTCGQLAARVDAESAVLAVKPRGAMLDPSMKQHFADLGAVAVQPDFHERMI
jgi:hypothetical protein